MGEWYRIYAAASAIGRGISPPFILKAQTLRPASRMISDTISIVVSSFTESILITFLNLLEVFYLTLYPTSGMPMAPPDGS